MATINDLSQSSALDDADQIPIYDASAGDNRKISASALAEYVAESISTPGEFITQYSSPNATGFSVSINSPISNVATNIWLLLTPLAGYAAGTIVLPAKATCVDGQEVLVNTTQSVTTLTVSGNGATAINGAPSTLAANAFFRLR